MTGLALRRLPVARLLAVWGLASIGPLFLLSGCGSSLGGLTSTESHTDAATLEACRKRADEVYTRQNRAEIYSPASGANSPLSGSYAGSSTRGLSTQFGYEQAVQQCVRNVGAALDQTGAAPATPPLSKDAQAAPPRR
jgi:hypothetical protein